jgi:Uri superfamily endonuclease
MNNDQCLPDSAGCYTLVMRLPRARSIRVGRLGRVLFPRGVYVYVGSALGSGGLRSRVGRHLRGDGKVRWHIDYLRRRAIAAVEACFYTVADKSFECEWSKALAALPDATVPVPHFGSSDCRTGCRSHLIAFPPGCELNAIQRALAVSVNSLSVYALSGGPPPPNSAGGDPPAGATMYHEIGLRSSAPGIEAVKPHINE